MNGGKITEQMTLYQGIDQDTLMQKTEELMLYVSNCQGSREPVDWHKESWQGVYCACIHELIELAEVYGFYGNIWQTYLTLLLVNHENAYSRACEITGTVEGSMNELVLHDFSLFQELFHYNFEKLETFLDVHYLRILSNYQNVRESSIIFNKRIRDRICNLSSRLSEAESAETFKKLVTQFYQEFGVGKFGLHKAFRVTCESERVNIEPIRNIPHVHLDDLVGYEIAKKKLIDNTEAFVKGRRANNCLLFGDAGTGKSSSIKGILNQYYDQGLRIIEIYKHQFRYLNDVIAQIKNRSYRFIIYMDDLSFEDFEIEYKYLKAVIEGGLEKKPENVLIYATSNRRHLIKESFQDKEGRRDQLHASDTVQEKLSLAHRFGITIFFESPDKKEFQTIVKTLASRHHLEIPEEELLREANKWELQHGGLSGRRAVQFIDYLLGQTNNSKSCND